MDSPFTSARVSRRAWTLLFTALPVFAQAPPPQPAPVAAPSTDTPEQKMQKAIADVRSVSERLAQTDVPMDIEPAFIFHA
jgi:hypothetical protein